MVAKLEVHIPEWALKYDKKKLRQALRYAGQEVASLARSLIRSSTGSGPRGASLPGEPPANKTGELAKSIKVKMMRGGEGVSIRDAAPYALSLEDGAHGGGGNTLASNLRMAGTAAYGRYGKTLAANRQIVKSGTRTLLPRPFLSEALEQREASIAQRLQAAAVDGITFVKIKP